MPRSAYYYQDCPTCGRTLQVRVEYLGRMVVCRHCRGEFTATDPSNSVAGSARSQQVDLLARANELLHSLQVQHCQTQPVQL